MEIISAPYVVTMNHKKLIVDGAILVSEGLLKEVGTFEELSAKYPDAHESHFPDGVLMPGLINAHCHIDRSGFYAQHSIDTKNENSPIGWFLKGLDYLNKTPTEVIKQRIQKSLNHFAQTGTTTIGAQSYYEDTYSLLKASGLRSVLFHEILSGPNEKAQRRFEVVMALTEKLMGEKNKRVTLGLAPYAAYLLSRNMLNIISRHAKDWELPLQMHLAESFAEMEFFYESTGPIAEVLFPAVGWEELPQSHRKTPIQHMSDIDFFTADTSIIGGLQLGSNDAPLLRRHLAKVVFCPSGNKRLQMGILPWGSLKEHGIPVALGTEFFVDSEGFNLWEEMRLAFKLASPEPTAEDVLRMATLGGARALRLDQKIGSLEVGKEADYLVVELPLEPNLNLESLCHLIIKQGGPSQIRRVAVNGNVMGSAS